MQILSSSNIRIRYGESLNFTHNKTKTNNKKHHKLKFETWLLHMIKLLYHSIYCNKSKESPSVLSNMQTYMDFFLHRNMKIHFWSKHFSKHYSIILFEKIIKLKFYHSSSFYIITHSLSSLFHNLIITSALKYH